MSAEKSSSSANAQQLGQIDRKADLLAGFLVFLIALPLCLGIAMASGYPPIAGVLTAIVGGVVGTWIGSARLTIKGPAAGLIVIAIGAVSELGAGDPVTGYKRALAVGVVAAAVQIIFALTRAGSVGALMPPSVVHGMLAAIGVIIITKQAHVALGVVPHGKGPLTLLLEIPRSVGLMNAPIAIIGIGALLVLFGLPAIRKSWVRKIPAPMVVLVIAVPLGVWLGLDHRHHLSMVGHDYELGPRYLVQLPGAILDAVVLPDFSQILSFTSIKYVLMFALVGSVESLLTVAAVDAMDPAKRASDLNRDLLATGLGNLISASIGGLPMISEIVRSKANIDNGATSKYSNFFHGTFLLLSVALIPGLLHRIPLAALAAMLIYTGARLASPKEFVHAYRVGREQLVLFVFTFVVTLATDLLIGVAAGLLLKVILHVRYGAPLRSLFNSRIDAHREQRTLRLEVHGSALFTNLLGLKRRLNGLDDQVQRVEVDFSDARVVDHTVLEKLHGIANEWRDRELAIIGLDRHESASSHPLAARRQTRRDSR